jgi:hypothetical protein
MLISIEKGLAGTNSLIIGKYIENHGKDENYVGGWKCRF